MTSEGPITEKTLQRLKEIRVSLLHLHEVLLEYQRLGYERAVGRIGNSYDLLHLVMNDQGFAWLHHLSELVVQIDQKLEADEKPPERDALALIDQARFLLIPSESGDDFQRKYFTALQQSPDVVLAHSQVVKLIGKPRTQLH